MAQLAASEWPAIGPRLAPYGRRLALRSVVELAQGTLWLAALGALLVQLAGRLLPIARLAWWTLAPLGGWALAIAAASVLRRRPPMLVARRLDAELGLKERIATALFLERQEAAADRLAALQREDAFAALASLDPGRTFAVRWARRRLLLAGVLAAAALALVFLPNPMRAVLEQRAAVARAAEQEAEAIERLRDEIAAQDQLPEADREELLRRLAELAQQLRANAGRQEEALANLSRVEQQLQERLDPDAAAQQAALASLASQLQSLAQRETGQEAEDASEVLRELAQALAEADAGQREEMAGSLAQMAARAAQAGSDELAQALAQLAQGAQSGDASQAAQAAREAAEAMDRAEQDAAGQQAIQRALDQIGESRRAVSGASDQQGDNASTSSSSGNQPGSSTSGSGNQPGGSSSTSSGTGDQPGSGQGQSQGQGPGQGQTAGSGGGAQADTLPPAQRTGQAGRPQGAGDPGQVGDIGDQVYVPWERRPGSGEEITIPGQDTGQGETEVRERTDPLGGTTRQALVPYQEVYQTYLDAATQAMEQSYIPPALRDYVRAYFSELEP